MRGQTQLTEEAKMATPGRTVRLERKYHVPRSQVWGGSRGRQSGNVHLHVTEDVRVGRISRKRGQALCGRSGWYERQADVGETLCERCSEVAERLEAIRVLDRAITIATEPLDSLRSTTNQLRAKGQAMLDAIVEARAAVSVGSPETRETEE